MVFEKAVNLLTILMCYFIIILPLEGSVIMYASDSLSLDTPISARNDYSPQTLPFEKGQHFEFEVSRPNLIGSLTYEIKKMSKDRILVSGIFTYYIIIPGEDGPTILWDDPITLKKSFWIDGRTSRTQSQDYVALLWNAYMGDSVTNYGLDATHGFGEDSASSLYAVPDHKKNFDSILLTRTPNIKKVNLGYVPETKKEIPVESENVAMIHL